MVEYSMAVKVLKVFALKKPVEASDLEFMTKELGSPLRTLLFLDILCGRRFLEKEVPGLTTIPNYVLSPKGKEFLEAIHDLHVVEINIPAHLRLPRSW